jgi:hypothetical protein
VCATLVAVVQGPYFFPFLLRTFPWISRRNALTVPIFAYTINEQGSKMMDSEKHSPVTASKLGMPQTKP